jgi:uncharacterized coiled-coil protein SlyX
MTILSELEQRLKKLEMEQHDQEFTLNDLGKLENEIRELEEILAKLSDGHALAMKEPESDYSHLRDLTEIEKFERKLAHIDEEFEQQLLTQKSESPVPPPPENVTKPSPQPSRAAVKAAVPVKATPAKAASVKVASAKATSTPVKAASITTPTGYVICLMFNPKAPPEWSGKGWCEPGKGMRYTNPALAKHTLQKLKNQWPDYPLKIFKR